MYKIFIISLAAILLQSCARCKSYDENNIDMVIEDYFGMYTKGSYWVYENNDKTKRDSVYVTEYKNEKITITNLCRIEEKTTFKLLSTANSLSKQFVDLVDTHAKKRLLYTDEETNEIGYLSLQSDTLSSYPYKTKILNDITINNKLYIGEIQELFIGKNEDHKNLYLQRGVGIIGWSINNETFNLIKKDLKS